MNIHHANDAVFSAVPAIRCRAVGAKWKKKTLLEAVGFDVPQGSICGLLGPNGAGKSTLLRMLTGLVPPDSGEVLLFGQKAGERTLAQVSYLPDRGQLPGWLSVADWLELASGIYPDWNRARQRELAQKLAVDPAARIGALSRGKKRDCSCLPVCPGRLRSSCWTNRLPASISFPANASLPPSSGTWRTGSARF
ncbi:ATP-binding cassette domain-containing protein [Cohnella algarum]|uniref:ATP-binding cassette domain-containing protein n=1 Tax=Cohnella algarum TaxID=2044859 RepID=UPI001F07D726|nr:ATP-binding cassette domain-containing protein [Cohnella algarum]